MDDDGYEPAVVFRSPEIIHRMVVDAALAVVSLYYCVSASSSFQRAGAVVAVLAVLFHAVRTGGMRVMVIDGVIVDHGLFTARRHILSEVESVYVTRSGGWSDGYVICLAMRDGRQEHLVASRVYSRIPSRDHLARQAAFAQALNDVLNDGASRTGQPGR